MRLLVIAHVHCVCLYTAIRRWDSSRFVKTWPVHEFLHLMLPGHWPANQHSTVSIRQVFWCLPGTISLYASGGEASEKHGTVDKGRVLGLSPWGGDHQVCHYMFNVCLSVVFHLLISTLYPPPLSSLPLPPYQSTPVSLCSTVPWCNHWLPT